MTDGSGLELGQHEFRAEKGRRKVTVVGAGNVGATCAQVLAMRDYADVVLVDIKGGLPQGKALDIDQMGAVLGFEPHVVGSNGYDETAGSDVVVITAGLPRKPGMSRDDLVATNEKIVGEDRIQAMVERTAGGGGEIVKLLDTSAWYAPGAAAAQMVDAIMLDEKRMLPCTAYLEGEYGIDGLYMGVPVKLGAAGIEQIVELDLDEAEQEALRSSAEAVREVVGVLTT